MRSESASDVNDDESRQKRDILPGDGSLFF